MSEYDQYKKDRQKLIESRKVKMSTPDGGAGMIQEDYTPIKPTTAKEKWDNYWYHYKALTFGATFGIILVFMFIYQMVTKTVYDATMTIVSTMPFESVTENFADNLEVVAGDYTANEKIDVSVMALQQQSNKEGASQLSPEMVQASFVKLSGNLSTSETFIFMVDDECYDKLLEMGVEFMDLSPLLPGTTLANNEKYPLKGTQLAELLGGQKALEEMSLCFIDYDSFSEKKKEKKDIKANYERDIAFFKKLLAEH